jgi:2-oxoglutarate ferredoxin oxidoreductase subunit beta
MSRAGHCEVVDVADVGEGALLVHDEYADSATLGFALSRLAQGPTMATPIGIFRDVKRPAYDAQMTAQVEAARAKGRGDLRRLLHGADSWTVAENDKQDETRDPKDTRN